jgi:endonuclease/exonuclease/phosphatase (EEP) superfamily protein YafD
MNKLRRFLEPLFILYALFLVLFLLFRFPLSIEWPSLLLLYNGAPYLFLLGFIFLLFAVLMQSRRIAGIYVLLLVVSLIWFLPILMPKFQSTEAEDSFRVLSFNLYPENTATETAETWLLGQDADILLLQELSQSLPELEIAYSHYDYTGETFALFSRYPIVESSEFTLDGETQVRYLLDVDGQELVVYNLHLLMPLNENEGDFLLLRYDESRRNAQIIELLEMASNESLPTMLVGDFNMSEWSPIYSLLSAQYQDAYRVASWGLGATWPAGESEELPNFLPRLVRLDYLWYRNGLEAISSYVGNELGSDHLPLIVEMRLRGEQDAD